MENGNRRGIQDAFARNRLSLTRFLKRFLDCPDDVEDMMQETFLKAYEAERSAQVVFPQAFLFRTARNLAVNKLAESRRRATDAVADMDQYPVDYDFQAAPEHSLVVEKELDFALRVLENLPHRAREVFILRKVHGLRQREIAKKLGISESTVEKHVARGLERIRYALSERG